MTVACACGQILVFSHLLRLRVAVSVHFAEQIDASASERDQQPDPICSCGTAGNGDN